MRGLSRNWYFEPGPFNEHDDGKTGPEDRDDEPWSGLFSVPKAVLQRHGAQVLDPSSAAAAYEPGRRATMLGPTVYRARALLIPADQIKVPDNVAKIKDVLVDVGMSIVVPEDHRRFRSRAAEDLRRLPRRVVLVPAPPRPGRPARPVVVDAWVALQALRSAVAVLQDDAGFKELVGQIRLEHLLFGAPTSGPSTGGHPLTGSGNADTYVANGGDSRAPVAVSLDAPARRPVPECGPRRPVVAVIDTGVRAHWWLDVEPDPVHRYRTQPDGFVAVDQAIQDVIYLEDQSAASAGDRLRHMIKDPWDTPLTDNPLIGELADASGHGSFIAGIVRQVAPDAQVLAIRIMYSDDVVAEGALMTALGQIADRVAFAQAGHMEEMVDVVSLSLGYFDESSTDVKYSSGLWQVIKRLLGMGVAVVASAGNSSTSRRCYPAAFAVLPVPGPVRLISVGALNPNGSKALFSNDGSWVRAWAAGAMVVSTFPDDVDASRMPPVKVPAQPRNGQPAVQREALDPNDYRGGFATWSGTSFSAPLLAANIAAQLLKNAAPDCALDVPGADAAVRRMTTALANMGWQD